MDHDFVLGGLRSYIGIRNSAYRHIPAECLGAAVLKGLIRQCGCDGYAPGAVDPGVISPGTISPGDIDMVICGNSAGSGGNITRLMALEAGLDQSVPAFTVDQQCASSLEAITTAAAMIESGLCHLVIAGGFESTSTQPLRSYHPNHPDYRDTTPYTTAKFVPGPHREDVMLQGAERTAAHYRVDKQDLDRWVLESHRRALMARQSRILSDIIFPVFGLERDEGIRPRMSQKLLDKLPPVLQDGRSLNAANACTMNDGAAFVVLCSDQYLARHGLTARCRILDACSIGTNPLMSPVSAVSSIENLLKRTGISMDEIGCIECNEAFAVIDVLFERAYPGTFSRYNQFGGALAYGHPYGASGAIIFLHLVKAMERTGSQKGICSVAAAGGIGTALMLER